MLMESELARRRVETIAAHFKCANDLSSGASCLLPLNCSSSLSSAVKRYDNRVFFARQGSSTQSCFMRQASMDLGNISQPGGACSAYVNVDRDNALEAPLYCRPAKVVNTVPRSDTLKSIKQDYKSTEPPRYARPSSISDRDKHCGSNKHIPTSKPQKGVQWVPRTNIAESGCKYVISMELSGVDIRDIKVEVNAKSLIVTGRRSTKWTELGCCSSDTSTNTYYKRQILNGPCQVVWPLPSDVNKDGISAEFMEGILQINIPKL
ncbi:hypothetical protein V2J09_006408 [Rumex salicifolius]